MNDERGQRSYWISFGRLFRKIGYIGMWTYVFPESSVGEYGMGYLAEGSEHGYKIVGGR